MKKILTFLSLLLAISCTAQRVDNDFNCLFSVQSVSGSNPTFTVTGTLSNSSGKFSPLNTNLDTADVLLCEYVLGGTRFTASFAVAGITPVSGNKVTLTLTNVSGRTVSSFPSGVHSIRRPTAKGLLPSANGESAELRTAVENHNLNVVDTFPKTAYKDDILAGTDAVTLVCVVGSDPDLIATMQTRTGRECAWAFNSSTNRYYFYNGSRSIGYRWIPLDSLPQLYPNYVAIHSMLDSLVFEYPDGSPAFEVDDAANHTRMSSDDQASIITAANDKTQILANYIELSTRGSGEVKVTGTASKSGSVEFYEMTGVGTNKVKFKAPDTLAADYILKLPAKNGTVATNEDLTTGLSNLSASLASTEDNVADLTSLSGMPAGSVDFNTFTGGTIPDDSDTKQGLQALETAHETTAATVATNTSNISTNTTGIANLVTLSGVAANATHLGTFTGSTIPDNQTDKQALQALETAQETTAATVATNGTAIGNLQTLSGVAANATNLGTFTGSTIADNRTDKQAFQDLETALEAGSGDQVYSARLTKHIYFDDLRNVLGSNASTVLGDFAKVQTTVTSSGTATHYPVFASGLEGWNHPGVVLLTTGSGIANTNGGSNMWNGAFAFQGAAAGNGNDYVYETLVRTGSIVSANSGNDYTVFCGFAAQALTNYTMNNITGFYYDTNNDIHLHLIIDSANVRTDVDLNTVAGLPNLAVDTWYKLKIVYTNSTNTHTFYVNNSLVYTKVGGFVHSVSPVWSIRKLVDNHSAQREFFIDYYYLEMKISR